MVPYVAAGIDAAQAGARVHALLLAASLVGGAVLVVDAFRPAVGRGAGHARQAGAVATVTVAAGRIAVLAAGGGIAGILLHPRLYD